MGQKAIHTKIPGMILRHMQSHCMTMRGMVYHVKQQYRISDEVIVEVIHAMIADNMIRTSFSVNDVKLYCNSKTHNLSQRIWRYMICMNYTTSYRDVVSAFGLTDEEDVIHCINIMVAQNLIIQNRDKIKFSKIERQNIIFGDDPTKHHLWELLR